MQLTKHTDYAFRVLIYLISMEEERTTIRTITQAFDISKSHVNIKSLFWITHFEGMYKRSLHGQLRHEKHLSDLHNPL